MPNKITHVFFDLDRTLWDFEQNSHDELAAIFSRHRLMEKGISLVEEFIKVYKKINDECWELYRMNAIKKEDLRSLRFSQTLEYFGIKDEMLAERIGIEYITNSPLRTKLITGSHEIVQYLNPKYSMHMITNGFEEVQHVKLRECGLTPFFGEVITSEMAGVKKPERQIFDKALDLTGAKASQSVYIGDDLLVDALGAVNAGWQAIYFNPHQVVHNHTFLADIQTLAELKEVL